MNFHIRYVMPIYIIEIALILVSLSSYIPEYKKYLDVKREDKNER